MRISRRRMRRLLRRGGDWLWPVEARRMLTRQNWTVLPMLALLLLNAETSSACLTVGPGHAAMAGGGQWTETIALDHAATVVHASVRRPRWRSHVTTLGLAAWRRGL